MFRSMKFFIACLAIVILASMTYISASSADSPRLAGEGAGTIGGYVVTSINYRHGEDPTYISAVELDLDKAAGYVAVKLVSNDSDYSVCINAHDNHWYCNMNNVSVSSVDAFQVVALGE